ncbi:hypothetical protein ABFS83_11G096400 [Erythranthe nasuta]
MEEAADLVGIRVRNRCNNISSSHLSSSPPISKAPAPPPCDRRPREAIERDSPLPASVSIKPPPARTTTSPPLCSKCTPFFCPQLSFLFSSVSHLTKVLFFLCLRLKACVLERMIKQLFHELESQNWSPTLVLSIWKTVWEIKTACLREGVLGHLVMSSF